MSLQTIHELQDLLYGVRLVEVHGVTRMQIKQLRFDSRAVLPGDLFVALRGTQVDGHRFINNAITQGAVAIICEELPDALINDITYLKVRDSGFALGRVASNFYDNPSEKLRLVGVTGTNGKTTVVSLLFRLFRRLGYKVGLISTIQYQINEQVKPSTHTTPNALALNEMLATMVDEGCSHCFMEVSSHGVVQGRVNGLHFDGGVFTNISHDHLDYHGDFKSYLEAKKQFFDGLPSDAFALVNVDDKRGRVMIQNTAARKVSYALENAADVHTKMLENSFDGLVLKMEGEEVHTRLIGRFNAYNLTAIYGVAALLGESKYELLTNLSDLRTAEGRFDQVRSPSGHLTGIVDYAHTPDALLNVLTTIDDIRSKGERVITIVGCGGDRDKAKRPVMAKVACELSDRVILTSDNPRSENPQTIIDEMREGVPVKHAQKVLCITDRNEAIRTASQLARAGDIILLAGKGHEKYQDINGVKKPFDDKKVLRSALQEVDRDNKYPDKDIA